MEFVTLNTGAKMPLEGFGVFQVSDRKECEDPVYSAVKVGYRLIDTAAAYQNESDVGKAVKKSGIPREEIYVTSKLWLVDCDFQNKAS